MEGRSTATAAQSRTEARGKGIGYFPPAVSRAATERVRRYHTVSRCTYGRGEKFIQRIQGDLDLLHARAAGIRENDINDGPASKKPLKRRGKKNRSKIVIFGKRRKREGPDRVKGKKTGIILNWVFIWRVRSVKLYLRFSRGEEGRKCYCSLS